MDMYSILRIYYVHITPDSVVQYTPKYSLPGSGGSASGKVITRLINKSHILFTFFDLNATLILEIR